jgi:hypothetical protein
LIAAKFANRGGTRVATKFWELLEACAPRRLSDERTLIL